MDATAAAYPTSPADSLDANADAPTTDPHPITKPEHAPVTEKAATSTTESDGPTVAALADVPHPAGPVEGSTPAKTETVTSATLAATVTSTSAAPVSHKEVSRAAAPEVPPPRAVDHPPSGTQTQRDAELAAAQPSTPHPASHTRNPALSGPSFAVHRQNYNALRPSPPKQRPDSAG